MNFPKRDCHSWIIAFLSIIIATREVISIGQTINLNNPPFWQFVLREFVFKTISQPASTNNLLYNEILDAPFYGGPSPRAFNNENALVSRGNVYRTPNRQWILCQEGCVNCESCEQQNNPIVKWTLRRVKRITSSRSKSPKWDLQLTVFPHLDDTSRSGENPLYDDMDGTNQNGLLREKSFPTNWENEETYSNKESYIRETSQRNDFPISRKRFLNSPRVKRYRVKPTDRLSPLTLYHPQKDAISANGPAEKLKDYFTPRLIMGIDQHGEKHLVHVVPVDSPTVDPDSTNYRSSQQSENSARISRTTHQQRDALSYQKLMERIMDSLNNHRSFIEKFLFADRLEPDRQHSAVPSSFSHPEREKDDDGFVKRNSNDYRGESSPGANRYHTDSVYQVQDGQLKRYADVTKVINMPSGEYPDHTVEYEPYVVSADDREERGFEALTDIERRRRNLISKRVASIVEHQTSSHNHTEITKSDTESLMKIQPVENSTNHIPVDSQLLFNNTDAWFNNASESTTSEILITH